MTQHLAFWLLCTASATAAWSLLRLMGLPTPLVAMVVVPVYGWLAWNFEGCEAGSP